MAEAIAAALLCNPGLHPNLIAAAAAHSSASALLRAMYSAVNAHAPMHTGKVALLAAPSALPGARATPGLKKGAAVASSAEGAAISAQNTARAEQLPAGYAELYLHLLCRMDTAAWRAAAEAIVSHVCLLAGNAPGLGTPAQPDTGSAEACESGELQADADAARNATYNELALCTELLMPLLPIVYTARSTGASRAARARLAGALSSLLADDSAQRRQNVSNPQLRAQASARGAATAGGPGVSMVRACLSDELRERLLTVLHAMVSDEWARWITCHQTRGKPQPVGPLVDTAAVDAAVRRAPRDAALAAAADVALLLPAQPLARADMHCSAFDQASPLVGPDHGASRLGIGDEALPGRFNLKFKLRRVAPSDAPPLRFASMAR